MMGTCLMLKIIAYIFNSRRPFLNLSIKIFHNGCIKWINETRIKFWPQCGTTNFALKLVLHCNSNLILDIRCNLTRLRFLDSHNYRTKRQILHSMYSMHIGHTVHCSVRWYKSKSKLNRPIIAIDFIVKTVTFIILT